jgi:hypothetical protein
VTPEACMLELRAEICSACKRWKPSGKLFDSDCWSSLPAVMQRACFQRLGYGFEEAYESAIDYIRNERKFQASVTSRAGRDGHAHGFVARVSYKPR